MAEVKIAVNVDGVIQWKPLVGAKVLKSGTWHTIKSTDKIWYTSPTTGVSAFVAMDGSGGSEPATGELTLITNLSTDSGSAIAPSVSVASVDNAFYGGYPTGGSDLVVTSDLSADVGVSISPVIDLTTITI